MNKNTILLLLITAFLTSCGSASLTTPPTTTQNFIPSPTAPPTQIAVPTITPYPPIQTNGPYLLYSTDWENLTILDTDGKGRKQFQLPNQGFVRGLKKAVSPDGKWLAYFTGSSQKEPYDLALHLFNLQDQTTILVADLIKPSFPENLEPVKTSDPVELENCSSGPCRIRIIELAFNEGIESLDWSPDSQALAFAAQIDGPSSDVYIYNLKDKSIRRLVSDFENVGEIDWSPNGKSVLYVNTTAGLTYTTRYVHVAYPDMKSVQSPKSIDGGKFWCEYGWINDHFYLIASGGEGAPPANFRYIDTDTLQAKVIWNPESELIALHPELHALLITLTADEAKLYQPQLGPGTYAVTDDGTKVKISDEIYEPLSEPALPNSFFAKQGANLYSIKIDDLTVRLIKENADFTHRPRISPNKKWFIVGAYDKIQLYSEDLELVKLWEIYPATIIWEPNSTRAFLYNYTEKKLHYVSIPNGELSLIDTCALEFCDRFDYIWLP